MKNIKFVAMLLSALFMSACHTPPVPTSKPLQTPDTSINKISAAVPSEVQVHSPNHSLTAHPWRLKKAIDSNGQRVNALFVDENRPLTLEFNTGHVRMSNTCNHMSGAYTLEIDNNVLNISPLIGTMMACRQPLMALDATIVQRLEGPLQLSIEDTELHIQNTSGDLLVFEK